MESYMPITWLNDFVFCPYSIYLHSVYASVHTDVYHQEMQQRGLNAHKAIDAKNYSSSRKVLQGLNVYSTVYKLMGKIDIYYGDKKILVERKRQIQTIYDGYRYQLYAQYFCMQEMGYQVDELYFYASSTNKKYKQTLPVGGLLIEFQEMIKFIHQFQPLGFTQRNSKKCAHCIYINLCDKTNYYDKQE